MSIFPLSVIPRPALCAALSKWIHLTIMSYRGQSKFSSVYFSSFHFRLTLFISTQSSCTQILSSSSSCLALTYFQSAWVMLSPISFFIHFQLPSVLSWAISFRILLSLSQVYACATNLYLYFCASVTVILPPVRVVIFPRKVLTLPLHDPTFFTITKRSHLTILKDDDGHFEV